MVRLLTGHGARFSAFISLVALALTMAPDTGSVHASSPGGGARRKEAAQLEEKVAQLRDLSAHRAVLRFNGQKFKDYVRSSPRNYSIIVMFTALSAQRQCSICEQASEEYRIVATSHHYSSGSSSDALFFAMVDFDEGPDVFQTMGLNTAPVFMHFPQKGKPKPQDTLNLQRVGFGAEVIAKWISERTDINIRVIRPPNYAGTLALFLLFAFVAILLYLRRNNLEFLQNKNAWGAVALLFVFAMISGQMWNHIRGPPIAQQTQTGMTYIHGSSQGQFILETYLVMAIYGLIVLGMILLTEAAGGKGDAGKRRLMAVIGLALFAFFYSLILSIFRSKSGGYPYSFLLK